MRRVSAGAGLVFFTLGSAVLSGLAGLFFFTSGRMPLGASAAGLDLGGYSYDQARVRLANEAALFLSGPLRLTAGNAVLEATPAELGLTIDVEKTLAVLNDHSLPTLLANLIFTSDTPLVVGVDMGRFSDESRELFKDFDVEPTNAALVITGTGARDLRVVPAKAGRRADRSALLFTLVERGETLSRETIAVPVRARDPDVTEDDLGEAERSWATVVAGRSYTLRVGDLTWDLGLETVASWAAFVPERGADGRRRITLRLNEEKVSAYLVSLAPAINETPQNPIIDFSGGRLSVRRAARSGRALVVPETFRRLERAVLAGEQDTRLVVETVEPTVTLEKLEALGVTTRLGRGESDFAGSPANRIYNIKVGAARFQGVLVKPGEEFSFNTRLGAVDAEAGYLPELVIKHNKTIPEYGGGLCQLSTTVFRAAVKTGLPILERQNHSFIVSYYGKPGFDATIYPGYRDFRFKNDTAGHLFLQMITEGTKLIVELYGAPDGRSVELKGPVLYAQNPDGSARAVLTRVLTKDGASKEEKFYSAYKPKALYPVERNPYE